MVSMPSVSLQPNDSIVSISDVISPDTGLSSVGAAVSFHPKDSTVSKGTSVSFHPNDSTESISVSILDSILLMLLPISIYIYFRK